MRQIFSNISHLQLEIGNGSCKGAAYSHFLRGFNVRSLCVAIVRFFAILSGATFGFVSVVMLLFALAAQAQNQVKPDSEPFEGEDFMIFTEGLTFITSMPQIEAQGLTKGGAAWEPWSGSYWPLHRGLIANRYASPTFAHSKNFIQNYSSWVSRPASAFIASGEISKLSPAEKYELLIGNYDYGLSRYMWNKGMKVYEQYGTVAGWAGICHGWSGATHRVSTSPYQNVTVRDVTGNYSITFYPNDIKGLVSYLWAESAPNGTFGGRRCRASRVEKDFFLRPIDPTCLDTNPMTWHLAMVNRVGLNKMSMVMDASAGSEVWNYPVNGYDYTYYDPKTFVPTNSFKQAVRPIGTLPNDVYRQHRSPKASYIVGIIMDTFHPALTTPNTGLTNSISTKTETFIYDLELDADYNIVGGEWQGSLTPDFIWIFPKSVNAGTREDERLEEEGFKWSADNRMPDHLAEAARTAADRGQLMRSVVVPLLYASARPEDVPVDEPINSEEPIDGDTDVVASPTPHSPAPMPPTEDPQVVPQPQPQPVPQPQPQPVAQPQPRPQPQNSAGNVPTIPQVGGPTSDVMP